MAVIKTVDLTGAALDWAVAQAEGLDVAVSRIYPNGSRQVVTLYGDNGEGTDGRSYCPSEHWGDGGPLIKRENIGISPPTSRVHRYGGPHAGWGPSNYWSATTWHAGVNGRRSIGWHQTEPLVAAMRCYVASKLGEEVDVPDELKPAPKEAP